MRPCKQSAANVTGVQGDVAKLADLDRLYEAVKTKGSVDVVFANAGVAEFSPLGKSLKSISTDYSASMLRERCSRYKRRFLS